MRRLPHIGVLLGVLSIVGAGCTGVSTPDTSLEGRRATLGLSAIQVGARAEDVRLRHGPPAEVRPYQIKGHTAEVWVYRHVVDHRVNYVPGTMHVITSHTDPLSSGGFRAMEAAVPTTERMEVDVTTAIVVVDGVAASVNQFRREQRSYE